MVAARFAKGLLRDPISKFSETEADLFIWGPSNDISGSRYPGTHLRSGPFTGPSGQW